MKKVFLLSFFLAWPVYGQEIDLPEKAEAKTNRLNSVVIKSTIKSIKWIFSPNTVEVFREYDSDPEVIRLRFMPNKDGQYTLICAGASGDKVSLAVCVITSISSNSPPVPKPLLPLPKPVTIEGFGLTELVKTELAKIPIDARGLAIKLAENFEWAAGKLSGTISTTIGQTQVDLDSRNAEIMNSKAWMPFFVAWKKALESLSSEGRLATADNWAKVYRETAAALREEK